MTEPEKLPEKWTHRDFPVLLEVARRLDQGETMVQVADVELGTGLSEAEVQQAGVALQRRGLVTVLSWGQRPVGAFNGLSGEAYFVTGLHPSGDDAVSALVAALRQAADSTEDPDDRSRLRALADGALGVSRSVLGNVLTAYLTAQLPR